MKQYKRIRDRVATTEKDLIALLGVAEKTVKRLNDQRDTIAKLQLKVGYLECPKHVYKYTGKRDLNESPYSIIWASSPMFGMLTDIRFVFTCTECKKEIMLKEADLSANQRASLRTLGILEKKATVQK
jgi:hypothetical protein